MSRKLFGLLLQLEVHWLRFRFYIITYIRKRPFELQSKPVTPTLYILLGSRVFAQIDGERKKGSCAMNANSF